MPNSMVSFQLILCGISNALTDSNVIWVSKISQPMNRAWRRSIIFITTGLTLDTVGKANNNTVSSRKFKLLISVFKIIKERRHLKHE